MRRAVALAAAASLGFVMAVSGAATAGASTAPDLGITVTTNNDGHSVSLLDPDNPPWGEAGDALHNPVTAQFSLRTPTPVHWKIAFVVRLVGTEMGQTSCDGDSFSSPARTGCTVKIPMGGGVNTVEVTVSIEGTPIESVTGFIRGGTVAADVGYELRDATGRWTSVAHDQNVALPATMQTALRYAIVNVGTIPFRVTEGCSDRLLQPHQQLTCTMRGVRPAQSLAGEYRQHVAVRDLAGHPLALELRGSVTAFSGAFALSRGSAVTGQPIVVTLKGLPSDGAFAVQYRLDEQDVPLGTSTTRAGTIRYGFVVRGLSVGPARLNIEHDGVTIASLPFEVIRRR